MNIKRMVQKLASGLETAYDWLYNDLLFGVAKLLIEILTASATLFYAITGFLPIVPQWAWAGMCLVMLMVGAYSLQDLIHYDDEEEEDEEEEEEIVEEIYS